MPVASYPRFCTITIAAMIATMILTVRRPSGITDTAPARPWMRSRSSASAAITSTMRSPSQVSASVVAVFRTSNNVVVAGTLSASHGVAAVTTTITTSRRIGPATPPRSRVP